MSVSQSSDLVPVSGQFVDILSHRPTRREVGFSHPTINLDDPAIPRSLAELDSQGTYSHMLSTKASTKFQIPFLDFGASGKRSIFIQEYIKYRDVPQLGGALRFGISIRWVISILEVDGKARIDNINLIAASAEFGYIRTNAKFEVIGINSNAINRLLPVPDNLTVEQYAIFAQSLNAIKALIGKPQTRITPKLLASSEELIPEIEKFWS